MSNGDSYIGEWIGLIKHGYGVQTYHNGDTYEGNWIHNKFEGQGKYFYAET
ncbi:hypothetical protein [Enterococcus rotai]|uniref:hypothetical protein n=1 Tax=Enterococcus rotai TaxID=118060 RepID=UPI0035C67663